MQKVINTLEELYFDIMSSKNPLYEGRDSRKSLAVKQKRVWFFIKRMLNFTKYKEALLVEGTFGTKSAIKTAKMKHKLIAIKKLDLPLTKLL